MGGVAERNLKQEKKRNLLVFVVKCLAGRKIPVKQALAEAARGLSKGQREANVRGHGVCTLKCILDHTIDNLLLIKQIIIGDTVEDELRGSTCSNDVQLTTGGEWRIEAKANIKA